MEGLHYIHLEGFFLPPVLRHINPLFSEALLSSTGVSTWRAGILIPVIVPSAIVFLFHMHTKEDNNTHENILMLKLGSAVFLFPPSGFA